MSDKYRIVEKEGQYYAQKVLTKKATWRRSAKDYWATLVWTGSLASGYYWIAGSGTWFGSAENAETALTEVMKNEIVPTDPLKTVKRWGY